jgi:hypothetical protein
MSSLQVRQSKTGAKGELMDNLVSCYEKEREGRTFPNVSSKSDQTAFRSHMNNINNLFWFRFQHWPILRFATLTNCEILSTILHCLYLTATIVHSHLHKHQGIFFKMTRDNVIMVDCGYKYSHFQSNVRSCSLILQKFPFQRSVMEYFGICVQLHPTLK